MAARDPLFWKRFSTAVHQDEEYLGRPELKHADSWLARQNRKKARRGCICWAFWLGFFVFVAAVIAVVIWLLQSGILNKVKIGDAHGTSGTTNQLADPNSGANKRDVVVGELVRRVERLRVWRS